jgi:hypothetical protein
MICRLCERDSADSCGGRLYGMYGVCFPCLQRLVNDEVEKRQKMKNAAALEASSIWVNDENTPDS